MAKHTHWRDSKAWLDTGLSLSSTSNEACKLYDAALTQYIGWYDEPSVGGLEATLEALLKSDPSFVMGRVISNGLELLGTGTNIDLNLDLKKNIDEMVDLSMSNSISQREKYHVSAIKFLSDGYQKKACETWERILVENPTDLLALKFAHDSYFYLGESTQIRDSIARVMPYWDDTMPLSSYLHGMYAFGLEETNLYAQAEKEAKLGLHLNPNDPWATHSMAHVLEMSGRAKEGIQFMSTTENDWNICGMIACHNYWHWALYCIEMGDYQKALDIYDKQVEQRTVQSGAPLDMVDAASLLYRLEMEGVSVGKARWQKLFDIVGPHINDHTLVFNDIHYLMAALGTQQDDIVTSYKESIMDFIKVKKGDQRNIMNDVGVAMFEAFQAYNNGEFAKAVEKMIPIRYQVIRIGGSHAQRDVFNQFLIHAALKSTEKQHQKLARCLLIERKSLKDCAPLTDRLTARAMALHID
ncbi:tetratricopeptide repeat protein 38-like [Anneissia japonica]|uniref:tetratricopeptide repeat protein 38-like n=1 Tax=Anneissia japonica TaxID=1529436 RepID=UPI001425A790|nr:tetratricopeptide repeat protein 38-like [Anneissia japonica]XP_033109121.1 tetratricopeptide repeat protein 38-like [Anneissia japonica]